MPRCPAGAMDEGPVDLRTRPKGAPGAALPLRKRPLRPAAPEPAAPRGPVGPLDALHSSCDVPAVPGPPHGVARPEALYYQGEWPSPCGPGPGVGHLRSTEHRTQIDGGSW